MINLSVNVNKVATLRNARGGNNPNVLQAALTCVDFMFVQEAGLAAHEGNRLAAALQRAVNAVDNPAYNGVLARHGLREVEADGALDLNAKIGCPTGDQVHHLGRTDHGLGGHTAFVDSGAADFCHLDQRHFGPQVGRHVGCRQAALPGADNQYVVVETCHCLSPTLAPT